MAKGGEQSAPLLYSVSGFLAKSLTFQASLLRKPLFDSVASLPVSSSPLVMFAGLVSSPPHLSGVKHRARLALVMVGKQWRVVEPIDEPGLMDTELDLALPSKEGVLVISSIKRKCVRSVDSRKKAVEGAGSRKVTSSSGKHRVPKSLSAARKLQWQLVVAGDALSA